MIDLFGVRVCFVCFVWVVVGLCGLGSVCVGWCRVVLVCRLLCRSVSVCVGFFGDLPAIKPTQTDTKVDTRVY